MPKGFTCKCNECGNEINFGDAKVKKSEVKKDGQNITITFFECEHCNAIYFVEVLDYTAKKLKDRAQRVAISVDKKKNAGRKISEDRMHQLQEYRNEHFAYQKMIMNELKDTIPRDVLISCIVD